jgi:GNAT superfamily N-acetyltransferase
MPSDLTEGWHTAAELTRLRTLYGRAASFWATAGLVVEDSRWIALSGAQSALFNEGLCHGPGGGDQLRPTVEELREAGFPATLGVAGEAMRDVQRLVTLGWTCVEAQPFMARPISGLAPDPDVRALGADDIEAARALVQDAYQLPAELGAFGVPEPAAHGTGHTAWGLFDEGNLVSYMGTAVVEDAAVVWTMATPARHARRGYAARLLSGALAGTRKEGATFGLLHSSAAGAPLYRRTGFEVLEWWQAWSRPRWVLARD